MQLLGLPADLLRLIVRLHCSWVERVFLRSVCKAIHLLCGPREQDAHFRPQYEEHVVVECAARGYISPIRDYMHRHEDQLHYVRSNVGDTLTIACHRAFMKNCIPVMLLLWKYMGREWIDSVEEQIYASDDLALMQAMCKARRDHCPTPYRLISRGRLEIIDHFFGNGLDPELAEILEIVPKVLLSGHIHLLDWLQQKHPKSLALYAPVFLDRQGKQQPITDPVRQWLLSHGFRGPKRQTALDPQLRVVRPRYPIPFDRARDETLEEKVARLEQQVQDMQHAKNIRGFGIYQ
jgi:hypothetical protein